LGSEADSAPVGRTIRRRGDLARKVVLAVGGKILAAKLQIPKAGECKSTRQRYIARQAQVRDWERQVAQDVLAARIFFSAKEMIPCLSFRVIEYEPKREESRTPSPKVGGTRKGEGHNLLCPKPRSGEAHPDRALRYHGDLHRKVKGFNRLIDAEVIPNMMMIRSESSSSEEEDTYAPGFLDDPEMRQGRHRHVMIGDRVSGCIVSVLFSLSSQQN
jgi:hypothetical protein